MCARSLCVVCVFVCLFVCLFACCCFVSVCLLVGCVCVCVCVLLLLLVVCVCVCVCLWGGHLELPVEGAWHSVCVVGERGTRKCL